MSQNDVTQIRVADIEHIRDLKEIDRYGVTGISAPIINGKVKSVGKIPTKRQLAEWLADAGSEFKVQIRDSRGSLDRGSSIGMDP